MEPIVIVGAGGHAKVVAQTLRRLSSWELMGFVDEINPRRTGEPFEDSTILGGSEILEVLLERGIRSLAIAFGDNGARLERWRQIAARGFIFPTIVDPHAIVADGVRMGPGSYVAAGAIVQPGAELGSQVIVNTGAIVEHDCFVGDGAHICPRACLAGHVRIGQGAWIGAGALVRDRVNVGESAFVGIGALVLCDVQPKILAYGQPAREIRKV
jgi:sugar O-acyltransferase (sialic acid O-acetyltransferase NeuD family)